MTVLKEDETSLKMPGHKRIIVCGVGNTLRGDDAVGACVVQRLESFHLSGVNIEQRHQLTPEALEDWLLYDVVIIVDASLWAPEVQIFSADDKPTAASASSHHTDISVMNELCEKLYNKRLNMTVCEVPARHFDIGQPLSTEALHHAKLAANLLKTWIENLQGY